ncbi:MAG: hypothetical protein GW912_09475, partial [Zetaproteobacteria bacterium]|nr:hypothetical protein [Flavobacteriales bacterium]
MVLLVAQLASILPSQQDFVMDVLVALALHSAQSSLAPLQFAQPIAVASASLN